MSLSAVAFAREFDLLKTRMSSQPAGDLKLLMLCRFWPELANRTANPSYAGYLHEFTHNFTKLVQVDELQDCSISELEQVLGIADYLSLDEQRRLLRIQIATRLAYAGDVESSLRLCAEASGEAAPPIYIGNTGDTLDEYELLCRVIDLIQGQLPKTTEVLNELVNRWYSQRGHLWYDRALCLFAESGGPSGLRGRMSTLVGTVDSKDVRSTNGGNEPIDEVIFENQVLAPNDPMIGGLYQSLVAVKHQLADGQRLAQRQSLAYTARFHIDGYTHIFTGDSIGLPAAVLTYAQVLRPNVARLERFISSQAVFTGAILPDGTVERVNAGSLPSKVERAFFSPAKYLVVPAAQRETADRIVQSMRSQYPRRNLKVEGAERLRDVVDNNNLIRAERMCFGEYALKRTARLGRGYTVPAVMLLFLLYALMALIDTRTFAPWWFDWHIAKLEVEGNRFKTLNADGKVIWESSTFDAPLDTIAYGDPRARHRMYVPVDFDGDGRDELYFTPRMLNASGRVMLFSSSGEILWDYPSYLVTSYPGDTAYSDDPDFQLNPHYLSASLVRVPDGDSPRVISMTFASSPARHQIRLFGPSGPIGQTTYLHTGSVYSTSRLFVDVDRDSKRELVLAAINNRVGGVGLLVLDADSLRGVSPPYHDKYFSISGMERGSQLYYVLFPTTPLRINNEVYSMAKSISHNQRANSWQVRIAEGGLLSVDGKLLDEGSKLPTFYYDLDSNFVPIRITPGDGSFGLLNDLLEHLGLPVISDRRYFFDSLLSEVVVYHGDSIVHHEAAGIVFDPEDD